MSEIPDNFPRIVDTHCHIDVAAFDKDRTTVIDKAAKLGVTDLVVPAIAQEGWSLLLQLCENHVGLHPALGLHPIYYDQHTDAHLKLLEQHLGDDKLVAIGEIGLDLFIENAQPEQQIKWLEAQLHMARDAGLPVLLHLRKSHDQVLAMLRRIKFDCGGIAHAFNGSEQQAQQFIDMGFKLGFGGVITFERAKKLRSLATSLPLESLVLETDAPDLSPATHHWERNSPEYLPLVMQTIAQLRGISTETVAAQTTANAQALFPSISAA